MPARRSRPLEGVRSDRWCALGRAPTFDRFALSNTEESMPFSMQMDAEAGIVIVTCSGELGLSDAKEGAQTVWGKPEWSGRSIVFDFRSAQLDVRATEVREIARFILERQPATPPPKIALVTSREVDFGLARMYEVLRQHPATEVRVFRDYEEAVSWARASAGSVH
jgi:hypothetical protein